MNKSTKDISTVYDRDNICVFSVLKYLDDSNVCLIVANCHLLFNNNRGDVKLAQAYQIVNTLNLLQAEYSKTFSKVNLILCGDFNSIPNSGVYKLITEGVLNCTEIDRRKV